MRCCVVGVLFWCVAGVCFLAVLLVLSSCVVFSLLLLLCSRFVVLPCRVLLFGCVDVPLCWFVGLLLFCCFVAAVLCSG